MALTTNQLHELTTAINSRLEEFEKQLSYFRLTPGVVRIAHEVISQWQREDDYLSRHTEPPAPEPVWDEVADEAVAILKAVDAHVAKTLPPDPDAARDKLAAALANGSSGALTTGSRLSSQATATLGPEHTIVTPFKPRTLAEADDLEDDLDDSEEEDELPAKRVRPSGKRKPTSRKMGHELAQQGKRPGAHLPRLDELVKEVQHLSMDKKTMPTMAAFDIARPATWATAQAHLVRLGLSWEQLATEAGLTLKRPK